MDFVPIPEYTPGFETPTCISMCMPVRLATRQMTKISELLATQRYTVPAPWLWKRKDWTCTDHSTEPHKPISITCSTSKEDTERGGGGGGGECVCGGGGGTNLHEITVTSFIAMQLSVLHSVITKQLLSQNFLWSFTRPKLYYSYAIWTAPRRDRSPWTWMAVPKMQVLNMEYSVSYSKLCHQYVNGSNIKSVKL